MDYLIGGTYDELLEKFVVYGGNNEGEVYIYELADKHLKLVDMILTNKESVVRNVLKVSQD